MTTRSGALSKEHVQAIGRLVIAISEMDSLLTDLIGIATGTHILHAITLVHYQTFANKVECLSTLFRLAFNPDESEDLSKLDPKYQSFVETLSRAKGVNTFRNKMVHSYWHTEGDGLAYGVQFKPGAKEFRTKLRYTAQQILKQVDEVNDVIAKLDKCRTEARAVRAAVTP
jgi:hypothetical protein